VGKFTEGGKKILYCKNSQYPCTKCKDKKDWLMVNGRLDPLPLTKFTGTVVLVSHDRYFLRSLVGRVFEIDHGEMIIYEGSYEYYISKSERCIRAA